MGSRLHDYTQLYLKDPFFKSFRICPVPTLNLFLCLKRICFSFWWIFSTKKLCCHACTEAEVSIMGGGVYVLKIFAENNWRETQNGKEKLHPFSPVIPLIVFKTWRGSQAYLWARLVRVLPDTGTLYNSASFHFFKQLMEIMLLPH